LATIRFPKGAQKIKIRPCRLIKKFQEIQALLGSYGSAE
jgi:hypothetical protein